MFEQWLRPQNLGEVPLKNACRNASRATELLAVELPQPLLSAPDQVELLARVRGRGIGQ